MPQFLLHGYGTFNNRNLVGPARWPHFDLLFVHRGALQLDIASTGDRLTLRKSEGVLIWPETDFSGHAVTRNARASVQHFAVLGTDGPPFDTLLGRRGGIRRQQSTAPLRVLERDIDRAQELAYQTDHSSLIQVRSALLALILTEGGFLQAGNQIESRIPLEEVQRWLLDALPQGAPLESMARHFDLSLSRFRDLFRQEHGISAGKYVQAFREREARRQLAEGDEPLKVLAARLGYADPVAFHRAFKNRTGMTPGQYRLTHRVRG